MRVALFRYMDAVIKTLDRQFVATHDRSREMLRSIPNKDLFRKPYLLESSMAASSCGGFILRSAAAVEQTFGGITTRLWDDPFEWTLPEKLSTTELVMGYLDEVEATRRKAFGSFTADAELLKLIPAPDRLRSILDLLVETVARSEHFQGRAFAVFQMVSALKPPRY